jgi:uncharacterized protein YcnI
MPVRLTRFIVATVALVSGLSAASPAGAHIQVQPTEVAPGDAALFTLLVPGETRAGTSKVELKVPPGVYPFSYEETPGWKRKLVKKPNGTVDLVTWTGHAAPDGLVRFTFLAGTPEKPGTIRWAAIQTYANGQEARWIGAPGSENPAPVTEVSESAVPQNAGGESGPGGTSVATSSGESTASDEGTDWPLTAAALLGFFFGLSALAILLVNRKNSARKR